MKVAVFDTHRFERNAFERTNQKYQHDLTFFETRLTAKTAILTKGFECVCCFVNDKLEPETLHQLKKNNVKLIALRSAGFNHVDLKEAQSLDLTVVRVPAYSPFAVAEHAVGLILTLNRKFHKAYARVRELNFSLDGLVGFDLHQKTVGVIGTGRIGTVFARIMKGFGCRVLAYDVNTNSNLVKDDVVTYVSLEKLFQTSDIISLHVPLMSNTHHLINSKSLSLMKKGVILVNTSRGALVDTMALVNALKTGQLGGAALDVYEEEENIFFQDLSDQVLLDDVLARLMTFPNVVITSHQGFLTNEALENIAQTTLQNIADFQASQPLNNLVILGS